MRHDWTVEEIAAIYNQPFLDLIFQAQTVHRQNFDPGVVQRSTLLSIKTGGCPENCSYCPQSAHYQTGVSRRALMGSEEILKHAKQAQAEGSTRFCMGAAWRQVKDGEEFDQILDSVRAVSALGLEVCCTLGMLTESQAVRLKESGCYAYNHNLDTSPEYYGEIISTRSYQERLDTLKRVRQAGITVCCGGIIGMGESIEDRLGLLRELANQDPHPESVPINRLVRVAGTPLEEATQSDGIDFVRIIATARVIMPKSMVRLSAGRIEMSDELQTLAFLAGANSIFAGDKLLVTENPSSRADQRLLDRLGLRYSTEVQRGASAPSNSDSAICLNG